MEFRKRQPIGVELVKRGVVTETDIERALEYQRDNPNVKLGDILYNLDICDPEILIKNLAEILGTKGIVLKKENIKIKPFDYISLEQCNKDKFIPFDLENGVLKVCFSDKSSLESLEKVRNQLLDKGFVMEQYITFETEIDNILAYLSGGKIQNTNQPETAEVSGTITKLVDTIIQNGINKRASDIHIEPMLNCITVRYRIDGQLFTEATIPKDKQTQIIGRLKAISNMHQEKQESQDGRILLYDDFNIRVSSQPNIHGEKFVLRLLKKDDNIRDIFELGYPGTKEEVRKSFDKRNSITIIAAPTGEGKTTTLYSIIDFLNKPEINITTIEDPVEIRIAGLNQIEIGKNSTFSDSLRTVLRQDPDIILVGEIRDFETAEIAIQSGQTGHYVLSTIHTIDSIEVINRLRKMEVSDYDISSTLSTSVSQRLVRKLCPHCKKERDFTEKEKEIINKIANKYGVNYDLDNKKTYDAVGCKECNNVGYLERIGIFEILDVTDEVRELIANGASTIEIRKKALEQNYKPLVIDGFNKIISGHTNLDEINSKLVIY